ncbi:MAG: alpha/beta hydrolase [Brevinematales bacterium]|nr:alpha/beta hydrolase [Brevinematales bacterium]
MKRLGMVFGMLLLAGAMSASDGSFVNYKGKNFFQSKYLKFTPPVIVYLPKDYAASGKKYPVLYAHDGQNLFDAKTSFAGEWQMDENLDLLVKEGYVDGVIIVGIWNTANRIGDYTPTLINNEYVKNQGGNLTNYAKFIIEELKPFIDTNYRTLTDRKNTGLIGSSLGGLASFYLLGMHPEVFGKAAAISASFWWDNERVIADMDKMKFPKDVKIYLDGGFKEGADESSMIKYMRDVYQKLKTKFKLKDIDNIMYYEDPVGTHSEKDWAKRGKMPLNFLYGKAVLKPETLLLRIEPEIYKKGDTLKISADIQVNPYLIYTLYNAGLKSANPKIIEVSKDGTVVCKGEGKADISLKFGGKTFKQNLNVLPKIDGMVYTLVRVTSETPVGEITAIVVKINDDPTNIAHTFNAASNLKFNFLLSYPANSKLVLNFQTKGGKFAVQTSGSPYIKLVNCKADQAVDVLLKSWEK